MRIFLSLRDMLWFNLNWGNLWWQDVGLGKRIWAFSAVVGSLFSAAHLSFHKSVGAFYFILLITPYVVVNWLFNFWFNTNKIKEACDYLFSLSMWQKSSELQIRILKEVTNRTCTCYISEKLIINSRWRGYIFH